MKKFYSLIIFLIVTLTAFSQLREWTGGSGAWNDASNWSPAGLPTASDIVLFKNVSATVSNVPEISIKGLILQSSNIILQGSPGAKILSVGENNSETALQIDSEASLTLSNSLAMAMASYAYASIDGVLIVHANSKFLSDGTSHTIVNGTLQNAGEVLSTPSTLDFDNDSKYEHITDKGKIPAATWHINSTCLIKGILTKAPIGIDQSFGNYIWDCDLQATGVSLGAAIPNDIRGNLVIKKAGKPNDPLAFLTLPENLKIGGSFTIQAGQCISADKNITINLAGDLNITGGSLRSGTAAIQVNFDGIQKQVYSKTGGQVQGIKFRVLNKACLDLGDAVLDGEGDFVVDAGAMLMTAHADGLDATGNSGAIQVKGKRVFSSEADYAFTGSVSQVTGPGLPATVRSLIIDNKAGTNPDAGVVLTKETLVTKELALLNGFLQTSDTQMLTIGENGAASGSDFSFVTGPISKTGSTAFTFPTGWAGPGGGRIPIALELMGSVSTIQAEYKRAPATDKGTTINAPLHHINYCEYWELFPVSGSPKAIVTMYYNAHSSCAPVSLINDFSSARVARSDGRTWSQIGNAGDSLTGGNGYVISDNSGIVINKEQRFYALGNITNATDPLPVMFDNVVAYEKDHGVKIEWSNLTERDIAIYCVERSSNGMDYTIIGQYLPTSNRDDKAQYTAFDAKPSPGLNFYRIKVIERSTKIIFSKVMRVETGLPGHKLTLYPNPVTNKQIMLGISGISEGVYDIRIINVSGQPVLHSKLEKKGEFMTQTLRLPSLTPPGLYQMIITGANYRETKSFIVQ